MATGSRSVWRVLQWATLALLAVVALATMVAAVLDDSEVPPYDPPPASTTPTTTEVALSGTNGTTPAAPVADESVLPALSCAVLGRNVFGDIALRVYVTELSEDAPSALDVEMELRRPDGVVVGVTSEPLTDLPARGTVTHDAETVIDAPDELDTVTCTVTAIEPRVTE